MRYVAFGLVLAVAAAAAGCKVVGGWTHGAEWERTTSEAPKSSPYMPTIFDEARARKALLRAWKEAHVPSMGLVGYLMTEVQGIYEVSGPSKLFFVFTPDFELVGFFTEYGATYRYIYDPKSVTMERFKDLYEFSYNDEKKIGKKYIGHYEPAESVAHLLKVPVEVALKPVSTPR